MNINDILKLLESNKDEKGIEHLKKSKGLNFKSFGIGLSKLKEIGKQIGKNHELATELWDTLIYDALVLSTIIDNPKEVTQEQIEKQVKDVDFWQLSHSFCSNLVCKTAFAKDKAVEWTSSDDHVVRRCGYALLYHIARDDKKIEDGFFEPYLDIIEKNIHDEENFVRDAMNNALMMMGQRSEHLNKRAIAVAKKIGKVYVDYGENSCEAVDCLKHLTGDRIQEKFKTETSKP
ncbi:MAG: DNA alkylation repair protein [Bacteroidia bacterium]|nr:DNA alkylation repair protein [Bacteroidia bacterium]